MHEDNQTSKTAVIKSLAIVGVLVTIILCIWLVVQVVRIAPGAFSSLASIADSLYNRENNNDSSSFSVATEKNIVNTGEPLTISWSAVESAESYIFEFTCTDGVAADVRLNGGISSLACGEQLVISNDTTSIDVQFSSEKQRFTDVPFRISAQSAVGDYSEAGRLTIVNTNIPQSAMIASETEDETDVDAPAHISEEDSTLPEETATQENEPDEVARETTEYEVTNQPTPHVTEPQVLTYTYIPTSDPSGYTELAVSFLGVGHLSGDIFVPNETLERGERGAIAFIVHNIGTRTSEEWSFEATLPSGRVVESEDQDSLKPNERAELIVGFDLNERRGTYPIKVAIDTDRDTLEANNSFVRNVQIQ